MERTFIKLIFGTTPIATSSNSQEINTPNPNPKNRDPQRTRIRKKNLGPGDPALRLGNIILKLRLVRRLYLFDNVRKTV